MCPMHASAVQDRYIISDTKLNKRTSAFTKDHIVAHEVKFYLQTLSEYDMQGGEVDQLSAKAQLIASSLSNPVMQISYLGASLMIHFLGNIFGKVVQL